MPCTDTPTYTHPRVSLLPSTRASSSQIGTARAEASSRLPIAEDSVGTQQRRAITHHVLAFSLHTPPTEQQPLIIADCRTATPPCQREQRCSPPGLSSFGTKTHLPADPCEWLLLV